jgi:hypothetical protein
MKTVVFYLALFCTLKVFATSAQGIICREDHRMANGSLREIILTPTDKGYVLQSQFAPSLNSPDLEIETWADQLACRIDEKSPLAFCKNQQDQSVVLTERREVFYDSLEENAKKKTSKHTDISVHEKGKEKKVISFAANYCKSFGGEA